MNAKSLRKKFRVLSGLLAGLLMAGLLVGMSAYLLIDFDPAKVELPHSVLIQDREGKPLRFLTDENGERCLWTPLEGIPERLQRAFITAEDERFFSHSGIDPVAILRATLSNLKNQRIVSGASTLTQQVVRSAYPRPRSFTSKFSEAVRAVKAEGHFTKEEILEHYLNDAPMGNNLVGVKLAAQVYFGKSLRDLNLSECATLAALPKAPGSLNPYRPDTSRLVGRRNWILDRMNDLGFISQEERRAAKERRLQVLPKQFPMEAPHFVDTLLARKLIHQPPRTHSNPCTTVPTFQTTLDLKLQRSLEHVVVSHREWLEHRGASQCAAMVVDTRTLEVLAQVGSFSYARSEGGYNNGCLALRSPGSTLKPFLYGLALEQGYTPMSLLEDTERKYRAPKGDYLPRNYDHTEYGPVTLRSALGNSLNLSTIEMINQLGYAPFHDWLTRANLLNDPSKGPEYYGLGLAIGNPEVTLEQLVAAYAMLANGGVYGSLRYLLNESPAQDTGPLLSPESAWLITDILSDPTSRTLTFGSVAHLDFPYRVAWKTGTSNGYRDSWIVGFTPEYTIGVWAGNFDGRPTYHMSGSEGAGKIFGDVVRGLYGKSNPGLHVPPEGVHQAEVCSHSGLKPTPQCRSRVVEWFKKGTEPARPCTFHTPESELHRLPNRYANWIHEFQRKGIDPPFEVSSHKSIIDAGGNEKVYPETIPAGSDTSQPTHETIHIGSNPLEKLPSPLESEGEIKIVYPLEHDRFVLDQAGSPATIPLRAQVMDPDPEVTWFLDGVELEKAGPPYSIAWKMEKGAHTLSVVGSEGFADSVRVVVE